MPARGLVPSHAHLHEEADPAPAPATTLVPASTPLATATPIVAAGRPEAVIPGNARQRAAPPSGSGASPSPIQAALQSAGLQRSSGGLGAIPPAPTPTPWTPSATPEPAGHAPSPASQAVRRGGEPTVSHFIANSLVEGEAGSPNQALGPIPLSILLQPHPFITFFKPRRTRYITKCWTSMALARPQANPNKAQDPVSATLGLSNSNAKCSDASNHRNPALAGIRALWRRRRRGSGGQGAAKSVRRVYSHCGRR